MIPDEISKRILFQDEDIIILDKPAGLAVHAAPGSGPHMESWLVALGEESGKLTKSGTAKPGTIKPGLAHRLDRDTSGCLVLGRHPTALRRLGHLFANGSIRKEYRGRLSKERRLRKTGDITLAISRVRREKLWLSQTDPKGSAAETKYRVLGSGDGRSWLVLEPLTGRTHQLRVHCAAMGCAVVADPFYGRPGHPGERLHLHARRISLPYYGRDPMIIVEAEPPLQMWPALKACGWAAP